jgi:hypothetical protein
MTREQEQETRRQERAARELVARVCGEATSAPLEDARLRYVAAVTAHEDAGARYDRAREERDSAWAALVLECTELDEAIRTADAEARTAMRDFADVREAGR